MNRSRFVYPTDEYIWSGDTFEGMTEPWHSVDGASFGIGAAPNCFFPLLNVEDAHVLQRDYAGQLRTSPGIGAFTPWHDRRSHATQDIAAGAELFVDYGYSYFEGSREDIFGLIPFEVHYIRADTLLKKYTELGKSLIRNKRKSCLASFDEATEQRCSVSALDETISNQVLKNDLFALTRDVLGAWPTRTLKALPEDRTLIPKILSNGGTALKDYDRSVRDVQYLQEHGTCMDHLVVQPSTIPVAGRGAFAKRDLPAGSIVAPVPLIHLPNRKVLNMYAASSVLNIETDQFERDPTQPIHQQLLLNYCFGHGDSTLLLCPYGIVSSLINHAPADAEVGPTANVKIVWSNKTTAHPEWRDKPIEEWAYAYQTGLGFEYVALRDIAAGEEVFVDYGNEWQQAWDEHVENWKPVERLVDKLNDDFDSILPTEDEWHWSVGDLTDDSQAVNLWCYNVYRELQGLPSAPEVAYPCKVILRQDVDGSALYTAEILERRQNVDDDDDDVCEEFFDEILWAVPRDAFAFGGLYHVFDTREYASTWTFRHDLRVPDELMPDAWKNLVLQHDELLLATSE
jgi:SET domain